MKEYLVIGLGSMGKRRVRCLLALGIKSSAIWGYDIKEERAADAKEKYGINYVTNLEKLDFSRIEAVIVSLPPDKHFEGAKAAIDHNKPVFIEASVILEDVRSIKKYNQNKVFIGPSCTLVYHPMIKKIKEIVISGKYGRVCNFSYHCGQYLPDWHPWEKTTDFYVGQRVTGGAREIVPFEFTWLTSIFGIPKEVKGYYMQTTDVGCDIEDTYVCSIKYHNMVGNMVVDVVSRYAIRNLILNFEKAQLIWRWDTHKIEIYDSAEKKWNYYEQPSIQSQEGYNANIDEKMYIEEMQLFLSGIGNSNVYYNTLDKDIETLKLLTQLENSDGGFER